MTATAQNPYKFVITLDEDTPEPQGLPIPPRQVAQPEPVEQPSPDLDVAPEAPAIVPGMKCWLGKHQVRVECIKRSDGTARIHLIADATVKGPAWLKDLKPIPCALEVGDKAMIATGIEVPLLAEVVQVGQGDMVMFYIPFYQETHQMHSAHVVTVRPRSGRQ